MSEPEQISETPDWRHHGVRVIKGDQLDPNTPQTPGMHREAAINYARVGAQKIWAGTVTVQPNAKTGAHHHGSLESVIYVVCGRARMRWGDRLEFVAEAEAATSFMCRPTCRIRRSTRAGMSRLNAFWFAVTTRLWSSTSISSRLRSLRRFTGLTPSISTHDRAMRDRVPASRRL